MEVITDIFQAHGRKLATASSIVLVIALSVSIANAVLFFVEHLGEAAISPEPATVRSTPAPDSGPSVDVASLRLFGTVEATPTETVVDAPETKLNLELQGVFTADDPDDSTAIVAERNKGGELFRIGDRLPGNATLEAVNNDHILIRRAGRVEKLAFEDASIRQQFSSRSATGPGTMPTLAPDPASNAATRLQNIRERIASRRQTPIRTPMNSTASGPPAGGIRDQIDRYRDRLDEDPQSVLNELGVSPVSSGESKGYRISGDLPKAALAQAGLQQNDIILSVNGRPVGNVVNDQAMIDQAMAAGRVRVEVQRADRRFFLTVPIP